MNNRKGNNLSQSASSISDMVLAAKEGETATLGRLLERYATYLHIMASTELSPKLRTRVSPSDVVQETLLDAHRDFGKFQGETAGQFVKWLQRILANNVAQSVERHLLTRKRDVRREVSLERMERRIEGSTLRLATLLPGDVSSPSDALHREEQAHVLEEALQRLPEDYRDVLLLRHLRDEKFRDIAEQFGRSEGAVRMLWLRAVARLREILAEYGIV